MTTLKPFDRITVDPNIMNGRPCIRGMRVQVKGDVVPIFPLLS